MNTLDELWHGNVTPNEKSFFSDPAFKAAAERVVNASQRLRQTLQPPQAALMDDMENADLEYYALNAQHTFTYAFCLGARLVMDILQKDL